MKAVWQHLWYEAVSSFWFLPLVMVIGGVALYYLTAFLDRTFSPDLTAIGLLIQETGLETARSALSAVATSMVTIAGLVIPITIVALQLASQEYGSRLIRRFMRDRLIQVSLGIFFTTFAFSLLLLVQLPEQDVEAVPRLSILIAILLSLASVVILILFIHEIARMIQPYNIIADVAAELHRISDRFFHPTGEKGITRREEPGDMPEPFETNAGQVPANRPGYIEEINYRDLALLAERYNLVIRIERRPGEFVLAGDALALARPEANLSSRARKDLARLFILGNERTVEMDIEFPIEQILETAAKSLTEDVNDVFTARTCVNWLEDFFVQLLREPKRRAKYIYRGDKLRLISKPFTAAELISEAFQVLWNCSKSNKALTAIMAVYLLKVIVRLTDYTGADEERRVLEMHAEAINRITAEENTLEDYEREEIGGWYQEAERALTGASGNYKNIL
jgi:uncharacterized membrane protein